jgi:hypothetical protein
MSLICGAPSFLHCATFIMKSELLNNKNGHSFMVMFVTV